MKEVRTLVIKGSSGLTVGLGSDPGVNMGSCGGGHLFRVKCVCEEEEPPSYGRQNKNYGLLCKSLVFYCRSVTIT